MFLIMESHLAVSYTNSKHINILQMFPHYTFQYECFGTDIYYLNVWKWHLFVWNLDILAKCNICCWLSVELFSDAIPIWYGSSDMWNTKPNQWENRSNVNWQIIWLDTNKSYLEKILLFWCLLLRGMYKYLHRVNISISINRLGRPQTLTSTAWLLTWVLS